MFRASAVVLIVLLALGCRRDRATKAHLGELDRSGVTSLTGAAWVPNDAAIERVVAARCAREVVCNSVGPDQHFVSGDACVREVKARVAADINADECPSGIDGKELDQCLDAIRNEGCTNPLDVVSRLASCRVGALCVTSEKR